MFEAGPLDIPIGIIFALLATLGFNYSPLIMKTALNGMEEIKSGNVLKSIKTMLTNKRWLLGLVVNIAGGIFYFAALQLAGITLVQPLLNFGFIVLAIAAKRMLGENFDVRAKVAITLLITMPIFMALSNVSGTQAISEYIPFLFFSLWCLGIIIVFYIGSQKVVILWTLTTGVTLAISALYMQWFTDVFLTTLDWGNLGATLWPALLASIVPLLLTSLGNLVANMVFMQIGLQKNPASRFYPINTTVNMIVSVIGGILIFGQTIGNWVFYIIGIVIGVAGILLLTRYQVALSGQDGKKEMPKPE